MKRFHFAVVLVLAGVVLTSHVWAGDWPQWRGPNRDGKSTETGLLKAWPADGPAILWKAAGVGGGYSAPAVVSGRVYGMGYRGADEVAWALSSDSVDPSRVSFGTSASSMDSILAILG